MTSIQKYIENHKVGELASCPDELAEWMAPRINPGCTRVMLAAAPKSGSTFLTHTLSSLLGLKARDACAAYGQMEQQIYLPRLLCAMKQDTLIGHQHIRASEGNEKILQLFGFKVIVTVRDLADTVISNADHHVNESTSGPMAMVTPEIIARMSSEEHYWFIIRMMLPWYFNFLVSWMEVEKQNSLPVHWVKYESLIENPEREVSSILKFLGLNRSDEEIQQSLSASRNGEHSRLNVGVAGRGKKLLSKDQLDAIDQFAKYYPDRDFGFVGLPKSAS